VDAIELSKVISHALRHERWLYELELDDEGWVDVIALLAALQRQGADWSNLQRADIERMIATSEKRRHELVGDRIRALYGHSVPGKLQRVRAEPPPLLFHGTASRLAELILREGLKPMGRQYVHLSVDERTALEVGRRKAAVPVLLRVQALAAHRSGAVFYIGNEKVWLADFIAPPFLERN
jgi:putative RNA 2'-phosphotransferase